jgi:hypothetical protein
MGSLVFSAAPQWGHGGKGLPIRKAMRITCACCLVNVTGVPRRCSGLSAITAPSKVEGGVVHRGAGD